MFGREYGPRYNGNEDFTFQLNELREEVKRVGRITGTGGIQVRSNATGTSIIGTLSTSIKDFELWNALSNHDTDGTVSKEWQAQAIPVNLITSDDSGNTLSDNNTYYDKDLNTQAETVWFPNTVRDFSNGGSESTQTPCLFGPPLPAGARVQCVRNNGRWEIIGQTDYVCFGVQDKSGQVVIYDASDTIVKDANGQQIKATLNNANPLFGQYLFNQLPDISPAWQSGFAFKGIGIPDWSSGHITPTFIESPAQMIMGTLLEDGSKGTVTRASAGVNPNDFWGADNCPLTNNGFSLANGLAFWAGWMWQSGNTNGNYVLMFVACGGPGDNGGDDGGDGE